MNKQRIERKLRRKENSELVETLIKLKKNKEWLKIAHILSSPKRKKICLNLRDIEQQAKEGKTIIVPGKILGDGMLNKKVKIAAFNFSKSASEKLKKQKIEFTTILEELEKNPGFKEVLILTQRIKNLRE